MDKVEQWHIKLAMQHFTVFLNKISTIVQSQQEGRAKVKCYEKKKKKRHLQTIQLLTPPSCPRCLFLTNCVYFFHNIFQCF